MTVPNAMTVDVEDYFHVAALAGSIDRTEWDRRELRVEDNTRRLLALFEASGVRATFFVLGWVAQRRPSLVREIQAAGHEIASHGMSHKLVYDQSPAEFASETFEAKALLEDICGSPILGYRASTYSITRRSLWALDILCEAGFVYDSSIFPIRHDRYGIPGARPEPNLLRAPGGRSIVEFPLSAARFAGVQVPVSGGGYFRLLPYWLTRAGLRQINVQQKRPFAFYLHPWEIDPQQPRVEAGALSTFRHYTNLSRCEDRLRRLLGEFRFAPMRDVLTELELLPRAMPTEAAA